MFSDPAFWVAVGFVIFVALVAKRVYSMACTALDQRAARIREQIEEAQRLREEAQSMLANYTRRQRDAAQEAEDIIAHAREEAQRHAAEAKQALEAEMKRREQQAMDRIRNAEAAALAEVRDQAVDIAMTASAEILAKHMGTKAGETLLDQAIDEVPQRLN